MLVGLGDLASVGRGETVSVKGVNDGEEAEAGVVISGVCSPASTVMAMTVGRYSVGYGVG